MGAALCAAGTAAAQVVFQETFGSTNGSLPTTLSTADANWASAACLNGAIVASGGDVPSDNATGSTHYLFHNTANCSYTANQAVWRTVTPVAVAPNTTYTFSYWVKAVNLINPPVLNQLVTPDAGTVLVHSTVTPALAQANRWYQRSVTFTTGAATTAVTLRIRNTRVTAQGNDFGIDDVTLAPLPPFPACGPSMYLSVGSPTRLFGVDVSVNPFTYPPIGPASAINYNAIAFNPADNFIYGIEGAASHLVRVSGDGTVVDLGAVTGLPAGGYATGEIAPDGTYYIKQNAAVATLYRIDLSTLPAVATPMTMSTAVGSADLAWYNGALYTAQNNVLYSITPTTPTTATVSIVGPYAGPTGFGGMIGASNGVFGTANAGGFYKFDPLTGAATLISGSPVTGSLDAAKCVTSPLEFDADLSVTKTDGATVFAPGSAVTYTIVVRNDGPFGALGATVDDPLPAGALSATWTCGGATGGASCTMPNGTGGINTPVNLPANSSVTFQQTVQVAPGFASDLANTVTVTSQAGSPDPDPTNNTATDIDTAARADLAISKSSSPSPYVPGASFTYSIVASNLGPSAANGATVNDILPAPLAAFTWTCTASGAGACVVPGGSGSINAPVNLPPGGSATFVVTGTVPPGTVGPLTNSVTITPPPSVIDPVPGNNSASDNSPADVRADLRITKTSTPNPFVPGAPLTYTIVATNAGPSDVTNVPVIDDLPAVFSTFVWTCDAGPGAVCLTPGGVGDIMATLDMASGSSVTFTSTGTVPSSYFGDATNTAAIVVPPTVTDPVPGNNTSTISNPPQPAADLSIVKTQTPDPYVPGAALTYQIEVRNFGPSDAVNARVQDALPAGLTTATWVCTPGAGASCGIAGGTGPIDTPVSVPAGEMVTFTVSATALPSLTGVLSNTATVTPPSTVTDPNPGNNASTVASNASVVADLSVVKTSTPDPYVPGQSLTYEIVVRNDGPSDVTGARVQDTFPPAMSGFTWTCVPAGGAVCGTATGTSVIDVLVDVPSGGSVTFTTTGTVAPTVAGPQSNSATVTPPPDVRDPDPSDNTSTTTTTGQPQADLSITKTSTPNPYVPGAPITYTIDVSNAGPSAVTGAEVRDVVPAALQGVTWTCTATSGTCPAPAGTGDINVTVDLAPGGHVTFVITSLVPADTRGPLTNTATVIPPSGVVDPDPGDNSGVNTNPSIAIPDGPADLKITQLFPGVAGPSGLLTFRLVTENLGGNTALNPYVTGMIPPGTTFVSMTPSAGGTCIPPENPPPPDPATGYPVNGVSVDPLRCTWPGLMKPGETHTVEFTVRVAPGTRTGQILWSCFWTWSQTDDPYHANNVVDAYLFVDDGVSPVGDLSLQGAALSANLIGQELAAAIGVPIPIRFWVTNNGPAQARGQYALILDTIEAIEVLDAHVAQGWVAPSGPRSATWDTGPIAPGQTVAVDLTIRLKTPGAVRLFAQRVSGTPGDPNASNEHAEIVLDGWGPGYGGRWVAAGNVDGAPGDEIVTAAGAGETPQVRLFTGTGADTALRFFAYERPFLGGVQVASCDVDGNGVDEVVTVPGPGRDVSVRVLDLAGGVVNELVAFNAFAPGFTGGASVSCADLDGDGMAEIVLGAGPGGAPEVQVYHAGTSSVSLVSSFMAYEPGFRGGVRVAAGRYAGRPGWLGAFDIATTPGAGRPAELRLWTTAGVPVAQLVVSTAVNGVVPTLGDVNGDGGLDLVIAADDGQPQLVRVFDVDTGALIADVPGGIPGFPVGVRAAVGTLAGGPGVPELIVGNGAGGEPRVRIVWWTGGGPVLRGEIVALEVP